MKYFWISIIGIAVIIVIVAFKMYSNIYRKIYFIGDSHTKEGTFAKTIASLCKAEFMVNAENGVTTKYFNDNKLSAIKNWEPDLIVIRLGTNDLYTTSGNYDIQNYIDLINRIKSISKAKIIVTTIENSKIGESVSRINNDIKNLKGVKVVDLNKLIDYKYQQTDKIHFSSAGYKQQGEAFYKEITKLF